MVRRYGEPIDVRSDSARGAPESFLWRGRVYLVREILDHWWERRAWWSAPAARAVHGDDPDPGSRPAPGSTGTATEAAIAATRSALRTEREVWRVEARRGRTGSSGVFDLCHDAVTTTLLPAAGDAVTGRAGSREAAGPDLSVAGDALVSTADPGAWLLVRVGD